MLKPTALTLGLATVLLTPALAQKATSGQMGGLGDRQDYATMHMQCNLGSFKIIPGQGRIEVSFTGTFMVSGLEGDHSVSGDLVKEFEGMERVLYHGTGTITVEGEWRALQWFGSNMSGTWYGAGQIRLTGEFDRNLNTGEYWFDDPNEKFPWSTNMQQFGIPLQRAGLAPGERPIRKTEGGN
jgi:hypothetical protein